MKTKRQIILETSKAYTTRNRSVVGLSCAYKDPDGNKCAVGRCLIPKSILFKGENNFDSIETFGYQVAIQFKEEYRGHSLDFWQQLQRLHDRARYWGSDGINKLGKEYVAFLLKYWKGK